MDNSEQRALVAECRASGMTAKSWCEAKGIGYRQYTDWATKANRQGQHKVQQWADVTIKKEERDTCEIKLTCGKWKISVGTGFNTALLADVLRAMNVVC